MTPRKITLEEVKGVLRLKVDMPDTLKGYVIIDAVQRNTGKSIPGLRKHAIAYAKRWKIPFVDHMEERK